MMNLKSLIDGTNFYENLITYLRENVEDFKEVENDYLDYLSALSDESKANEIKAAIQKQMGGTLVYYFAQGIKANELYFENPVANDFTRLGITEYLDEHTVYRMHYYKDTEQVFKGIDDEKKKSEDEVIYPITEYRSFLFTYGIKLAHYFGFILGNELLYIIKPGYACNHAITCRYKKMLEEYLRLSLSISI